MKKILLILLTLTIVLLSANNDVIIENKKLLQIKSNELVNKGMYKDAIVLIEKGITKYPNNDYLIALLGRSYKGLKDIEKAGIHFQEALKINPNNKFALAYMEETKKTKQLLKNEIQEDIYSFLKDKGVDLLFIFLGFLAGEIIATLIFRCDKENWKLIIYKVQLGKKDKLYMFNLKYLIKIIYKYIFGSACPLKTVLLYFTFLITLVLIFLVIEVFIESESLINIKTNQEFWQHICDISIYSTIILIVIWLFQILIFHKNEKEVELKLFEIMHKMYQNQDIIELHNLCKSISNTYEKGHFDKYINEYIIDKEEFEYLIANIQ